MPDIIELWEKDKWNIVVTNYKDFRKIVCEYIKQGNTWMTTDEAVEEFIKRGGGEGIIRSKYHEGMNDFAKGLYVSNDAAACAMNLE